MPTSYKHIALVDDHVIIRNGLKELIEKLGNYRVVKQYDDGENFLEAQNDLSGIDLVILDYSMPRLNGLQIMEALAEQSAPPILFLTLNEEENTIIQLFRLGARGYLKKNCSADELKKAIESILQTGYYHNEFLTLSLRNNVVAAKKTKEEEILEQLSPREREFLKLVCHEKEYTYEQIADKMNVQHRTVDGYRESLFEKFSIKSKTGLVLFVLKYKLFELL